jgi:uncharacterized membrane protein
MFAFLSNDRQKNNKVRVFSSPHLLFLFISIPFGIIFVFLTPPFQSPDEDVHFYRSYQISDLQIISHKIEGVRPKIGDMLPSSLRNTAKHFVSELPSHPPWIVDKAVLKEAFSYPLNPNDRTFISVATAHIYSPVPYIASSAGIFVGKLFDLSPLVLLYFGRVANLFVWIVIVFYAIKIIPIGKYLMLALSLMPMSLFIASTISADVITNSLSFFIISFFLNLACKEKRLTHSDFFMAAILIGIFSLCKQGYNMLCLLFLLIPMDKVSSRRKYFGFFALFIMLALLPSFLWYQSISHLLAAPKLPRALLSSSSLFEVIEYYFKTVFNDIVIHGDFYIQSFIGNLGHLDVPLPAFIVIGYFVLLFSLGMTYGSNESMISMRSRMLIFSVFIFSYVIMIMIFSGFYGDPIAYVVIGIQGRYFIPVALLLPISLRSIKISSMWYARFEKFSVFFIVTSLSAACYRIIKVFYLP